MTILPQRLQQTRFALLKFTYLIFDFFQPLILYGLGFRAERRAFNEQHAIGETLSSVIRFNQEHQDMELGELINHFIWAFIDKFITYPILLFQKGRDE